MILYFTFQCRNSVNLFYRSKNLLRLNIHPQRSIPKEDTKNSRSPNYIELKNVRAHCYCASLLRTLFIKHARATSLSSVRTESKTQNIELMTLALTWCANIFVGCSVNPTFFRQITCLPFLILAIIPKNQKNLSVGRFNYFS